MTKIHRTLAQRCKSILGMIVAGMLLFGGATQAQNMNRYIELKIAEEDFTIYGACIEIKLATDTAKTTIKIVSDEGSKLITTTDTNWTKEIIICATYKPTITIYGDVKKFKCYGTSKIANIDLSNNTALTYLDCYSNKLTSLDVSQNTALKELYCSSNQLTSLDISKNTALIYLSCSSNQLTSLDVSQNTALTHLYCYSNQLTSLDLSNNTKLCTLSCYGNPFTTAEYDAIMCSLPMKDTSEKAIYYPLYNLNDTNAFKFGASNSLNAKAKNWSVQYNYDRTEINPTVGTYKCPFMGNINRYITLNVTKDSLISIRLATDSANIPVRIVSGDSVYDFTTTSTSLTTTTTYYAGANTMTIYGDVKDFRCNANKTKITGIDVSKNTALTYLSCYTNQLTSLDLSSCTALTYLSCYTNQLTSLDLSSCTALTYFYCYDNQLTSLDVSKNTALTNLHCYSNQLTSLNVSGCTALTELRCSSNQLTSLDVSKNVALRTLSCFGNPFTTAEYDAIMCSLPMKDTSENARYYPLSNSSDTNATKFAETNSKNSIDKNWKVLYSSGGAAIPETTGDYDCNGGGGEDPTNISEINISNIELYPNPANSMLTIKNATANVQIFDITGRMLINVENKETNLLQINVSNLSKGMYFVKVGNYTTKFVKE